jgi:hypothetical protein
MVIGDLSAWKMVKCWEPYAKMEAGKFLKRNATGWEARFKIWTRWRRTEDIFKSGTHRVTLAATLHTLDIE